MSLISIYIDTNCINVRKSDKYLNELEKLNRQKSIIIEKTDVLDTELREGKGYSQGLNKSLNYIESRGAAVFGHSRYGHAKYSSQNDSERLSRILKILWGTKTRSQYSKQEIRDAIHISTACYHGGTFFVTKETALLKKTQQIEKEFIIKIRNPSNCLEEIIKNYLI